MYQNGGDTDVDIEAITRMTPQEQINFEKNQNLFSIVKTIEFLVSHSLLFSNSGFRSTRI